MPPTGLPANAMHMWEFLEELSQSDPAEYDKFVKEQLASASAPNQRRVPEAGFCVRAATGKARTPLWINICSHPAVKPPSSTSDGSVPLAVGVPRGAVLSVAGAAEERGSVCDVVVATEVTARALREEGFREELAALAVDCVKEVLGQKQLLPGGHPLAPGFRSLPPSRTPYVGQAVAFVDARSDSAEGHSGKNDELAAGLENVLQQLGGLDGAAGKGKGAVADLASLKRAMGLGGGSGGIEAASGAANEPRDEATGDGSGLRLPGGATAPRAAVRTAAAGGGAGQAAGPLVQVVGSIDAPPEVPDHSIEEVEGTLKLRVELPRLDCAAGLDARLSDTSAVLRVVGLYELKLELPRTVDSGRASCRFDKKRRRLTVTMPVR